MKQRLEEFVENEAKSCSMDFGCITPEYVFRMWGGTVPMEEIAVALKELKSGKRPNLGPGRIWLR